MRISRRALFFLAVALVFLLMIPPTPPEFRWLNLAMAGLALFWATLLGIEDSDQPPSGLRPAER